MGKVIRELREAAGLTQAELGDLVGIKGTMIYKGVYHALGHYLTIPG